MTNTRKYLRGWQAIADRYDTTPRSCQRMVSDQRLPRPVYIGGSRFPMWEIDVLDNHDRKIIIARAPEAVKGPQA